MIHYFIDDKKDTDNGYLLIISKRFKSYGDLPRKFNEDLDGTRPKRQIGGESISRIFGGNTVDIRP